MTAEEAASVKAMGPVVTSKEERRLKRKRKADQMMPSCSREQLVNSTGLSIPALKQQLKRLETINEESMWVEAEEYQRIKTYLSDIGL